MSNTHMIGAVSIIEHHVAAKLNGARLVGVIFERREVEREGYWEDRYTIAWENTNECGTHWANVNSNEEVMITSGHYCLTRQTALRDMLDRSYFEVAA